MQIEFLIPIEKENRLNIAVIQKTSVTPLDMKIIKSFTNTNIRNPKNNAVF